MNRIRYALILLLILWGAAARAASGFSFIYIQGDKQTPFYVKLDEAMQPRFGKNYCIIPQLAPGEAHLEILFQQNAFPAQKFTVMIPEGSSRGFLLVKRDNGFALYDLLGGFYLQPGNEIGDDKVATSSKSSEKHSISVTQSAKTKEPEAVAANTISPKKHNKPVAERSRPAATPTPEKTDSSPQFIGGIELPNNAGANTAIPSPPGSDISVEAAGAPPTEAVSMPAITNSDCPSAIRSEEFATVFGGLASITEDEDKVNYLSKQMDKCYTSWMARALAMRLQSDAARFSLLKKIYSRITDQAAFALLDDLLKNEVWKAEFAKLIKH